MTQRVPAAGRAPTDIILLLAALAATIYLLFAALDSNSFTIGTLKFAAGSPMPDQRRLNYWHELDEAVLGAARNSGQENLVADLVDRRSTNPANRFVTALFYGRATYALWPRRMFITFPSVVITGGDQLAAAPVPRDAAWLAERRAALVQFRVQDLKSGGELFAPPGAE